MKNFMQALIFRFNSRNVTLNIKYDVSSNIHLNKEKIKSINSFRHSDLLTSCTIISKLECSKS